MEPAASSFLDLCERTAEHAHREADLRARRAAVQDPSALAEIDRALDHEITEKRIALYLALNSIKEPRLEVIFIPRSGE